MSYPTRDSASDVWSLRDVYKAEAGDVWPVADSDIYFANVSLLINADGETNGSTNIVDASNNAYSITVSGNAQIDTATFKYGDGSLEFDGADDYLTVTSGSGLFQFDGDFTIECWVKTGVFSQDVVFRRILSNGADASNSIQLVFYNGSTASSSLTVRSNINHIIGSTTVADNNWHHVALTREGTSLKLFIDGVQDGSTATTSQVFNANDTFVIGRYYTGNGDFNGFIDDLRITKGVARYTANFTPPTKALPTS